MRRFFVDGRARPDQHNIKAAARPPINDPLAADSRRPKALELTPKRLSYVGSIAERIDHRPDLAPLVRMGTSQRGRGVEAEGYFARRADRLFTSSFCPKTFS